MQAVAVAEAAPVAVAGAVHRAASYTTQEDLMITQSYNAVSENSVSGNYQKSAAFKEQFRVMYTQKCIDYSLQEHLQLINATSAINRRTNRSVTDTETGSFVAGTNLFTARTADSLWNRFKQKIANL